MAVKKTFNDFVKYALAATGDPQLVFASFVDGATAREMQDLRDELAQRGITVEHLALNGEEAAPATKPSPAPALQPDPPKPPAAETGETK